MLSDVRLYEAALSAEEVEFAMENPPLGGGSLFQITEIARDLEADTVTITWTSRNGGSYAMDFSDDLSKEWLELNDDIPSDGETTTAVVNNVPASVTDRYFRVREN